MTWYSEQKGSDGLVHYIKARVYLKNKSWNWITIVKVHETNKRLSFLYNLIIIYSYLPVLQYVQFLHWDLRLGWYLPKEFFPHFPPNEVCHLVFLKSISDDWKIGNIDERFLALYLFQWSTDLWLQISDLYLLHESLEPM